MRHFVNRVADRHEHAVTGVADHDGNAATDTSDVNATLDSMISKESRRAGRLRELGVAVNVVKFVNQRTPADAELLGRLCSISVAFFKCGENRCSFNL